MSFIRSGAQRASSTGSSDTRDARSSRLSVARPFRRSTTLAFRRHFPRPVGLARTLRSIPHLAVAAAIALAVPFTFEPAAVNAACGTSWDSKKNPPETIKVLRTATGNVQTVDFRDYVGIVMASGEWPYYLEPAALEVGATAVKQYAWYYALDGRHRSWYVTDDGECYDVRDDTNDQLFKPERAEVKVRQLNAIEATWGLTLRKNGRFFLTGYRYGDDVPCASDANGWKIYERSVRDCAQKGWGRQQIQEAYLKPNIEFIWNDAPSGDTDTVAPTVSQPQTSLRENGALSGKSINVAWSGSDDDSGLARYDLERSIDGGGWKDVDLSDAKQTQISLAVSGGKTYRFRVRARDVSGNWSGFKAGPEFRARVLEAQSAELTGGTWHKANDGDASGNVTRYARTAGAIATLTFTGRGVALIAPQGPGKGQARILVDGKEVAVIDLAAATKRDQRVVFARTWDASATRTIRMVLVQDQRVDLDAVLVID